MREDQISVPENADKIDVNKNDSDDPDTWTLGKRFWDENDPTVLRQGLFRRLTHANGKRAKRLMKRSRKWADRLRTHHPTKTKLPVFVLGSNRSGTQMVCEAIGNSPHGWDYQESEANIAFKDFQLREDWIIKWLIRLSPARIISFGNILDSQFADLLQTRFENSKTIWVYRRYEDAANSSVHKWGDHFKNDMVRWVAKGELEKIGPRGKRISKETIELIRDLYHADISNEDGACLYWYMRNQLYFDLLLDQDPRVLLIQYEDAVLNQEKVFKRIFNFLGFPYDPAIIGNIFSSSVNKHPWPGIDPRIQRVCSGLKSKLDIHYAREN